MTCVSHKWNIYVIIYDTYSVTVYQFMAATIQLSNQGDHDKNHRFWNIVSTNRSMSLLKHGIHYGPHAMSNLEVAPS